MMPRASALALTDVLIIGAGPAGLAVAIRARQAGLGVLVVDRAAHPPLDKPCGEGLMPDAVARLEELGVRLAGQGRPFFGIRYLDGDLVAEGRFPGGAAGLGLRRTRLHQAMVEQALELGANLVWGVKVTGFEPDNLEGPAVVTAVGEVLRGRWLVAADGLRSPLRAQAGLVQERAQVRARQRFGVRRHFRLAPWTDVVEVYWAQDGSRRGAAEAYVTPVATNEVGVAILWSGSAGGGFDALLARFPELQDRLQSAAPIHRDLGCGPLLQRVREVHRGRLALVGDAGGYLDAITGEGLALAFHQAFALVEAIRAGDLRAYGRAHRRIRRLPDWITRAVLALDRRASWRRPVLSFLAGHPDFFARLLGVHARLLPLRRVIL